MLFRSDFLKRGYIPEKEERKQQNLSKIAGLAWRQTRGADRQVWEDKARQVLAEHSRKYPNYKFNPSPKGTKKKNGAAMMRTKEEESLGVERLKELVEKYTPYIAENLEPVRKRKVKQAHSVGDSKPLPGVAPYTKRSKSFDGGNNRRDGGGGGGGAFDGAMYAAPTPSGPPISFVQYGAMVQQNHGYNPAIPSPLRNAVPRRPSTSMGFAESHKVFNYPGPDNRDTRISAARAVYGGNAMQMHDQHFSSPRFQTQLEVFNNFPYGIIPVPGMPMGPPMMSQQQHQQQQQQQSISEPSSSPSMRSNNDMFNDPENPLGPAGHFSASASASTPSPVASSPVESPTIDFGKFAFDGQTYNLSSAVLAPSSSAASSPSAMEAGSPSACGDDSGSAAAAAAGNSLNLTIELPYPSASSSPADSSQCSPDGSAAEEWMFGMDVDMHSYNSSAWFMDAPSNGDANVTMGNGEM